VIFRGETLAEVYFDGLDEHWGRRLGVVHHGPDTLHDSRSITKSVTGLVSGIALVQGKAPGSDAPLLAQFPEYADLVGDPLRDSITVGDALAMKMGAEWNEDLPYTDRRRARSPWRIPRTASASCWTGRWWRHPGALVLQWRSGSADRQADRGRHRDGAGRLCPRQAVPAARHHAVGLEPRRGRRALGRIGAAADRARPGKIGQLVLDGGMFDGRVPREGRVVYAAHEPVRRSLRLFLVAGQFQRLAGLIVVVLAGDYNGPEIG
jgi:Beta-lactamase